MAKRKVAKHQSFVAAHFNGLPASLLWPSQTNPSA